MMTLKEARAKRLLSVRELAKAADVAPSTIYLAETGQRHPQFSVIRKLAKALDVEPTDVVEFAAVIEDVARGREEPPSP